MRKADGKVSIPVIYATDQNYFFYMVVSITSLAENAEKNTFYHITVLTAQELGGGKKILKELMSRYSNIRIKTVIVDTEKFSRVHINNDHISTAAFYRLAISDYIQEDKCIYLDSDTLVTEDLQELWNYDITGYVIAGSRDIWIDMISEESREDRRTAAGIPGMEEYINSGVLVFNLKKIRQEGWDKVFYEHLKKNYRYEDQDILNVCCYHRILRLPDKWNNFTSVFEYEKTLLEAGVPEETISHYKELKGILHYINKECRPWEGWLAWRNWHWWQTAEKWKDMKAYKEVYDKVEKREKNRCWKECLKRYASYKNLIIWGFVSNAEEACDWLMNADVKCSLFFCDKDSKKQQESYRGVKVISPTEAYSMKEDSFYLIISKRFSQEIKDGLRKEKIPEDSIQIYEKKDITFYRTLDERYYRQELEEIFLKERIKVSDRQQVEELAKHQDWQEKYFLNEWIWRYHE